MSRAALFCLLLAACDRRSDSERFLAAMEENEALLHTLAPETPPDQAGPTVTRILENLKTASTLTRDVKLSEQFSKTLADLHPIAAERYNPPMLERLRASCRDCHARFKE